MLRLAAADTASIALGLGQDNPLDRGSGAGTEQAAWSEAMNRALWPALLGAYLRQIVSPLFDADAQSWLRDWATCFVRGGAPLPTLLVGSQPYGVLPVSRIVLGDDALENPTTNVAHVESVLAGLRDYWERSLAAVPHLDPNVTDAADDDLTEGDLAGTVSRVLGSVPHPTGLQLREVVPKRDEYALAYAGRMALLGFGCSQFHDANGNPYPDSADNPAYQRFVQLQAALVIDPVDAFTSAAVDFHLTDAVDGVPFSSAQLAEYRALGDFIADYLTPLVTAHRDRTHPVAWFLIGQASDVSFSVGDAHDPQAFFAYHGDSGTESPWTEPLVAGGHGADDVAEVARWLADLADGTVADEAGLPLLRQLLGVAVTQAAAGAERDLVDAGLRTLRELVDLSPDPVAELERLFRETLGTAGYRLDAWYTAVAAWRLENKRARTPRGLQVGAYGVLVDVRRRRTPATQGFVAAPSLQQATTAAVLRAGWAALGGSAQTAGLAVDLSSDRIRRAAWLIDGVRRGHDLGQLLGSRLERRLHEAGLDTWIEPLRSIALAASGAAGAPTAIVDGLLLARARSGREDLDEAEESARDAIDLLLKDPQHPDGDPTSTLADLVTDLDAVADAITAQTVHALARGAVPTARAALATASSGEISPVEFTVADTPHPGLLVHHRLVVLVDPNAGGAWPGAQTSWRALAAPGVEAWAESVLADAAAVSLSVRFVDPTDGTVVGPFRRTLADTPLSALDLVFLAPGGEATGLGRLADALAVWAETLRPEGAAGSVVVQTDLGRPSLDEVVLAARAVRRLVSDARDLDARDLAEPDAAGAAPLEPDVDPHDLAEREGVVRGAITEARSRLAAASGTVAVRSALAGLLGGALPGALTVSDEEALPTQIEALVAQLDDRLTRHDALVADAAPLATRLALLVGQPVPLAQRFSVGNGDQLAASLNRRRTGTTAVIGWLQQAGRVDPGADRLRVAVDLCEAVAERPLFDAHVVQLPDHPGEAWVALTSPTADERGRLSVVLTGATPTMDGGVPLAGLVVGGWNEALARTAPAAGLAVHVDANSSRAPQAVLLCVARDTFSFEGVRDLVGQAVDLARMRMIGPQDLVDFGQYLPATYLPSTISSGGTA